MSLYNVGGSDRLQVLFEQWVQCAGHWTQSSLLTELQQTSRFRKRGARKWLTTYELTMKFGSSEAAEQLKACKEGDAELCKTHVRFHPDAPGVEETRLGFQGRGDDDDDDQ